MPRFLIRETGIHFIDVFRYLLGPVERVTARLARLNPAISGEDAGIVLFDFGSGARGLFDANRLNDHVSDNRRRTMGEMLLEGSKATVRLDGYGRLFIRNFGSNDELQHHFPWRDLGYGGDCVRLCLAHIANAIRTGQKPMNTASDYLDNLRVEDAIYRSAEDGRTVSTGATAP
jgi:predicted dehydrogenase